MAQRYNQVGLDISIVSASDTTNQFGEECYLITSEENQVTSFQGPREKAPFTITRYQPGNWTIPKSVTGPIKAGQVVRVSMYKGKLKDKKSGQYDNEFYWEPLGANDRTWIGWAVPEGATPQWPYEIDGSKEAGSTTVAAPPALPATPAPPTESEGADLMAAIANQEGGSYADKDSTEFIEKFRSGDNNYNGGQSQDEFRRSKQEMRWTEAVHMAYVAAAEVDPNWTKIEANAHRIYAIIERGPQADILAQIEQDS
jgi:hypothetical protein